MRRVKAGSSSQRSCSESRASCGSSTPFGRFATTALPQNFEDAIFGHSLKTYGWVYLIVAIVLILCAFGVLARSQFSRWIGIFHG